MRGACAEDGHGVWPAAPTEARHTPPFDRAGAGFVSRAVAPEGARVVR